uniref:Cupin-like domain-containing protein n=1 Tax=viral metagenome TaxID=1070528 RepID=A0A6C0F0U1_9ZZZZ
MKEVIAVLVFCLVLFIYLHVFFHLKKCDDLEIYEICDPSKEKLEEICDIRQPVVTFFSNDNLMENCNFNSIKANYGAFDIKIRNVKEHDDETELYVPLAISESIELFKKDKDSNYLSERNSDFLEDTGLIKHYRHNDMFLRPSMVSSCMYDIIFASLNVETPLRYEVNYRNYFLVTHGKVIIRVFPPKSIKYLYATIDYDNFEFISPVNPWNVQSHYRADFDKLRSMDITLIPGQMVHIPAYWWYSIRFAKSNTSICSFKYKTYMSTLAISNHLFLRLLQRQNTKRVIAKKMDINMNKVDFETIPMLDGKEKENMGAEVKINIVAASVSVPPQVYVATNDTEVTKIEL